jgi:hypothetical protein
MLVMGILMFLFGDWKKLYQNKSMFIVWTLCATFLCSAGVVIDFIMFYLTYIGEK